MSKRSLFSFNVGDFIVAPDNALLPGYNAKVIYKSTVPMGFTEGQLVKIEYGNGLIEHYDCSEEDVMVEPVTDVEDAEVRVKNILLTYFIKVKPTPSEVVKGIDISMPVGWIPDPLLNVEKIDGFLPADGRAIKKTDYPELYSAIGDLYSVERKKIYHTPTLLERVKKLFKIKYKPTFYIVEIKNCTSDEFRLPDLRAHFIK